jgi:hypothetical protein
MSRQGFAVYKEETNELEVTRPGETMKRRIRCTNINPRSMKVHGVSIDGDEISVFTGPLGNPRPNRRFLYLFSSLSGGSSTSM